MESNQCYYKKFKMVAPGNLKAFDVVNFVLPQLSQFFIISILAGVDSKP